MKHTSSALSARALDSVRLAFSSCARFCSTWQRISYLMPEDDGFVIHLFGKQHLSNVPACMYGCMDVMYLKKVCTSCLRCYYGICRNMSAHVHGCMVAWINIQSVFSGISVHRLLLCACRRATNHISTLDTKIAYIHGKRKRCTQVKKTHKYTNTQIHKYTNT